MVVVIVVIIAVSFPLESMLLLFLLLLLLLAMGGFGPAATEGFKVGMLAVYIRSYACSCSSWFKLRFRTR